jgi:hypothetical protein
MSSEAEAFCENSSKKIGAASSARAVVVRESSPAPTLASYQASTPRYFKKV